MITGGTRGLGREMALVLLEAGAKVAIVGTAASTQMEETVRRVNALGASKRFLPVLADLRRPEQCERVCKETLDAFGFLEVLINNAGIPLMAPGPSFWTIDPSDWLRTVDTNINGVFFVTRGVVPQMIVRGHGKIINISSGENMMVRKNASPYGPSKAFLEAATSIWSQELTGTGVTVNVLHPGGGIDTAADLSGMPPSKKLPPSITRAPTLWLCSNLSDGYTGGKRHPKAA